jgi:acetyl-CoA carboxylase carboxyltransferase component
LSTISDVGRREELATTGGRNQVLPEPSQGRLTPLQRLEELCDEGSLTLLRSDVVSKRMGAKARAGDGVIAGAGRVDGRPVFCYAQDPSYLGGSLGEAHAESIIRVLRLAGRAGAPVVGFIESGGARMQEGLAALGGYGRIFREHVALSGRIPQISVICGASAGGGSYSPALTDFVVMTERASMFLTGPAVVREVMGEDVTAAELGGHKVHEKSGVAHFTVKTD